MRKLQALIILIFLIILAGCSGKSDSLSIKSNINKITLMDGTSGNEKILTDQKQIESFLNLLNSIKIKESDNQETKEGYRYRVILQTNTTKYEFTSSKIGNKYINSEELISLLDKTYNKSEE
ncbi:hypothetical protein [Rummeliibacillus pycnus]|uniref:hypothetical protein n=1 Tax=Rummeliibacillus pycnus TaxID=101070 RepID=UPI003D2883E4